MPRADTQADPRGKPVAFLLETFAGERLVLPMTLFRKVVQVSRVMPVPGVPAGIVGLADVRGRPTTLIDPLWLIREASSPDPRVGEVRSALLLAPPREHLALARVSGDRLVPLDAQAAGKHDDVPVDAERVDRLVARLARMGEPVTP